MVISQATEYAIRALLHLANSPAGEIVSKRDICKAQEVTPGFLIKIMQPLIAKGLVKSYRGIKGGFTLGKPAEEINLWNIVEAMEGPILLNKCMVHENYCKRNATCPVHVVWAKARDQLRRTLSECSLAHLIMELRAGENNYGFFIFRTKNKEGITVCERNRYGSTKGTNLEERVERNFRGETSEVGLYLAMARQAQEQGFPEVAIVLKEVAWEEAAHAARFAEMNGKIAANIKENLENMLKGEQGAAVKKAEAAEVAQDAGIRCAQDFFRESSHDEGRHARILQSLLKRYFA